MTSSRSPLAALLALVLIVAGCLVSARSAESPGPSEPPPSAMLDEPNLVDPLALALASGISDAALDPAAPETIAQLRARIATILEREQVPGVGLALVDHGQVIWSGGVGVADLETGRPVTAETVFRVASITKSVVALGVARLYQENRLDLDAPLRDSMPELEIGNRWADEAPITLAHALEHTAGFDDMRFSEWWAADGAPEPIRPREALAVNPRSRVARWRPGSRMAYANPGYTIAGLAIEDASGEVWTDYLEREVLRPLDMPTAGFARTPELRERLATGYLGPGEAARFRPLVHAPAGALLASPRELAGLVKLGLGRGWPLLRSDAFDRIETTATLPYLGTDLHYGLGNYGDVLHPVVGRGHDGGLPGFWSCYRYFPELDFGYVVLLNSTHSFRAYVEIRALVFAYLARDRKLPRPPIAPPDDEAIAAAAGYYGFASPRIELLGFLDRALLGLTLRPVAGGAELELLAGGRIELVPTGDGGFRHPSHGGTSIRATTGVDGDRIVVAGLGGYFEAGSSARAHARLWALAAAVVIMQLAIVWGLAALLVAIVRRLGGRALAADELRLHLWPALASASFVGMLALLQLVMVRQAFCDANLLSVGLCAATLVFPACSAAALATVLRASLDAKIPVWQRALPTAAAIATFGMSLYLVANGIVGLRVWAW